MDLLTDLGTVVIVATVVAIVMQWLRQPLILAYLATGLILSAGGVAIILDHELIDALAKVGVVFLLFMVGMELDWRKLQHTGPRALAAGVLQVLLTAGLGFALALSLGFSPLGALYLGFGLTFASTIVVVAALDRRHELDTLQGRLLVGVLLVQDLVAIALLIVLGGVAQTADIGDLAQALATTSVNGAVLLLLTYLAATVLLPPLFRSFNDSHDVPVLTAVGWAFLFTGLSQQLGLSLEIGALLAGVSLAALPQSLHLKVKIRPLRDFFMLLFFVSLGLQFGSLAESANWPLILLLSSFVILVHPVVLYGILGLLGFRARTAFLAAIPTTQVSEFSLIVAGLGLTLGHLGEAELSLMTGVGISTFLLSTYAITYSHQLYHWLQPLLRWPRVSVSQAVLTDSPISTLTGHSVLVGARHLGHAVLRAAQRARHAVVVLDLDPGIVISLNADKVPALLGDATEEEVLEAVRIHKAVQLISTVSELDVNERVVRLARSLNRRLRIIVVARAADDALRLYEAGADYVAITHHISGDVLVRFLKELEKNPSRLSQIRSSHIEELKSDRLDFRLAHHHLGEHR